MKINDRNKKNDGNKDFKRNHNGSIKEGLSDDEHGNFSIIMSSLLLISFLILSMIVLNTAIQEKNENREIISSNQFEYAMDDYIRNMPLLEREALEELSDEVIRNERPCSDSKGDLKEIIDGKLENKSREYWDDYNIQINSSLIAIENTSNPFSYKFKIHISSVKGDNSYENAVADEVDCINLKDPVPLLYLKGHHGLRHNETSYSYGNSLSEFLRDNGVENHSCYINATSPFIIRKCPFDPYKHHGDDGGKIMKNCRDNGYFHESRDGACYLCRLEGKSGCEHYGFETFINPQRTNETGLVSACGSDHVIFSDDIYPGVEVIYSNESVAYGLSERGIYEILYLDPNGHKVKYGMGDY